MPSPPCRTVSPLSLSPSLSLTFSPPSLNQPSSSNLAPLQCRISPERREIQPLPSGFCIQAIYARQDKRLPSFLSERLHTRSHLKLVVALTRTHTDRYFCYVSSVDSPLGSLNKQTYLACGEGTAKACLSRLAAPLLLAQMHHANLHSRLAQLWFLDWSEPTQRCGFADFS